MRRESTHHFLFLLIILASASLACKVTDIYSDMTLNVLEYLFPDLIYGGIQQDVGRWDIEQCNAMNEVNITLKSVKEWQDDDSLKECEYRYEITNINNFRLIYFSYFHYGDYEVPAGHEDGWQVKGFGPNLKSYDLVGSLMDCPKCDPVRSESVDTIYAVIYDIPECAWITDGGVHFDILKITEGPLICPCTLLSPEHIPDFTEGLIRH